ncbi:MAG TPA: hypothetical protein VF720_16620, partial [Candidatus Eisenbacteria bacterium]
MTPLAARRNPALIVAGLMILVTQVDANTYPVAYSDNQPRATATYVEDHHDHGAPHEWHSGVDIPRTAGGTLVRTAQAGTLGTVGNGSGMSGAVYVAAGQATADGPWSILLPPGPPLYLLDVISVTRTIPGIGTTTYTVESVGSLLPGFGSGRINLAANQPDPGAALPVGSQVDVSYFYYSAVVRSMTFDVAGDYHQYAHIANVHQYFDWDMYPATAANRVYGYADVPPGRSPLVLPEGFTFAAIDTLLPFDNELPHVHFSQFVGGDAFPANTVNPLYYGTLGTDDPMNMRPEVEEIEFRRNGVNQLVPAAADRTIVYGRLDIFADCRDSMGGVEVGGTDTDADTDRETGAFNAEYWITANGSGGSNVASSAAPNAMFKAPGVTELPILPLADVFWLDSQFELDVNTDYHLCVTHVNEDRLRHWASDAPSTATNSDGSDAVDAARANERAKFKDGPYDVHARAADVVGTGNERTEQVVVDNFRPMVKEVFVEDANGPLYHATWNLTTGDEQYELDPPDPDEAMLDEFGNKQAASGQFAVDIRVTFTEAMQNAEISIQPLGLDLLLYQDGNDATVWSTTIAPQDLSNHPDKSGKQMLTITGIDWAGNELLQLSESVPVPTADLRRDAAGQFQPLGGADTIHRFGICTAVTFIIDDTGSMTEELEGIKETCVQMINEDTDNPDFFPLYRLYTFKDNVTFREQSEDPGEVIPEIQQLEADAGGLCPENSPDALYQAAQNMQSGGVAYFATDASANQFSRTLESAMSAMENNDVQVNELLTDVLCQDNPSGVPNGLDPEAWGCPDQDCGGTSGSGDTELQAIVPDGVMYEYRRMAAETGGILIHATKPEAGLALKAIHANRASNALLFSVRDTLTLPGMLSYPVPVDSSVSKLFILFDPVAAESLVMVVHRPGGAVVDTLDADVVPLVGTALTFLTIDAPIAGEWLFEISGRGSFQLRVGAASPFTFRVVGAPRLAPGRATPVELTFP